MSKSVEEEEFNNRENEDFEDQAFELIYCKSKSFSLGSLYAYQFLRKTETKSGTQKIKKKS